jgi:hypothetical protein
MAGPMEPVQIGEWYRIPNEPPFEVVALDVDQNSIEIQYFDGTLEELDFEAWTTLPIEPSAAPEDWSGAMDIERVDCGLEGDTLPPDLFQDPLNIIDHL